MLLESNAKSTADSTASTTTSGNLESDVGLAPQESWKIDFRAHRPALALFGLLASISVHDLMAVLRYPTAVGVNGYYYVLQVENLRTHGHLYFSKTTPVVLYGLTGLSYLTNNSIAAVKLGGVALHILLCLGLYLLVSEFTRSKWIGLSAGVIVAVSGLRLYLIVEFVSNLGAAMLLVWSAWCWIKYLRQRKGIWAIGSGVLLSLALLSHRSAVPLASLLMICAVLQNRLLTRERASAKLVVALSITFLFWVAPALLAFQPIIRLPQLLVDQVTASPKIPLDRYAFPEELVLLLVSPLVLLFFFRRRLSSQRDVGEIALATVALFSLAVTLNPFLETKHGWGGIAERLRVFSYVEVAILAPGLIWLLLRDDKKRWTAYTGTFIASMLLVSAALPWPNGMRTNYMERRQALIQSLGAAVPKLGPSPIIVAAHGDEFVVTATTRLASQQRPPSELRNRVYWLLSEVSDAELINVSLILFRDQSTATVLTDQASLRDRWDTMSSWGKKQLLERNPGLSRLFLSIPAADSKGTLRASRGSLPGCGKKLLKTG